MMLAILGQALSLQTVVQNKLVAGDHAVWLETDYPKWELLTAEELWRVDQKIHQGLREKYGKG